MDSKLEVHSVHGEGSTFFFEVLFELSQNGAQKNEEDHSKPTKKVVSESNRLKVLIAEDNLNNMVIAKV